MTCQLHCTGRYYNAKFLVSFMCYYFCRKKTLFRKKHIVFMSLYSKRHNFFFIFPLFVLCGGFFFVGQAVNFISTILGYMQHFHHSFFRRWDEETPAILKFFFFCLFYGFMHPPCGINRALGL